MSIIAPTVIFLLLSAFFILIVLIVRRRRTAAPPISPGTTGPQGRGSGSYLNPCVGGTCNPGLSCDGSTLLCKKSVGEICKYGSECADPYVCSGRCAPPGNGLLNDFCPCGPGYVCTLSTGGYYRCKGTGGATCSSGTDCYNDICAQGRCVYSLPLAYPCSSDDQCSPNFCVGAGGYGSFCQPADLRPSVEGAACAGSCVGYTGSGCDYFDQGLVCVCSEFGIAGKCTPANRGIGSSCDVNSVCADFLVCSGTTGRCGFPRPDPNDLLPSGTCVTGMSAVNGFCLNSSRLGCDSGTQCSSGLCNGKEVVTVYSPSSNNLLGSKTLSVALVEDGPTVLGKRPKRFYSPSTTGTYGNTLYLVDSSIGVYSSVISEYNVEKFWSLDLASTPTMTVIDAVFQRGSFYVAFSTGTGDALYSGPSLTSLSPYNGGVQLDINGNVLPIDTIDVSDSLDLMILSNSTVYVKAASESRYKIQTVTNGRNDGRPMTQISRANFYNDVPTQTGTTGTPRCSASSPTGPSVTPVVCSDIDNISYVAVGPTAEYVEFSGSAYMSNVGGGSYTGGRYLKIYDYSVFNLPGDPMSAAKILALGKLYGPTGPVDNVVVASFGGNDIPLPQKVGDTSVCCSGSDLFYVFSVSRCT